jgi:hypothetical protein
MSVIEMFHQLRSDAVAAEPYSQSNPSYKNEKPDQVKISCATSPESEVWSKIAAAEQQDRPNKPIDAPRDEYSVENAVPPLGQDVRIFSQRQHQIFKKQSRNGQEEEGKRNSSHCSGKSRSTPRRASPVSPAKEIHGPSVSHD